MNLLGNFYLAFSDSAKYAITARNLMVNKYENDFAFFNSQTIVNYPDGNFPSFGSLPVHSYLINLFFRLFGVSDFSVMLTTIVLFTLSAFVVYRLSYVIFRKRLISILSVLATIFSYPLIDLAKNGASEITFILLILLSYLFVSFKNKTGNILAVVTLVLMYFTRPQAFIFIIGTVLYYLLINFEIKKAVKYFVLVIFLGMIADKFLIAQLDGKYFTYSILDRGLNAATQIGVSQSPSDQLRGLTSEGNILGIFKKIFYNLYNFYKALPNIASPYMWGLFAVGLFGWSKDKLKNSFKISVLFVALLTFIITALTIPFYRYIHPIVPLVYIVAIASLVEIVSYFVSSWSIKAKDIAVGIVSSALVLFFGVGQTLGIILLDSRFERKMKNTDKAPIYVEMSYKLKEITNKDMVIVTNLDTWGSWYGERKTIWFPLEPNMILPVQDNIDAIYLTSYMMDDQNYYMGEAWREIFNNPEKQTTLPEFKFVSEYKFSPENNYQNIDARAILLVRKENDNK